MSTAEENECSKRPSPGFDIDRDIRQDVLRSCVKQIQDAFYLCRAHGVEMIVDTTTAYYNASGLIADEQEVERLMESDTMKACFHYIKSQLGKEPYYLVANNVDDTLNGVYMHGVTIGNVMGCVLRMNRQSVGR